MKKEGLFEQLAMEFTPDFEADNAKLPLRMQILATAFREKWDMTKTNEALLEKDCETLYARSYFEASLLYALDHGLSYKEWRELFDKCSDIYEENADTGRIFSGGKITLKQLEEYVRNESNNILQTEYLTKALENDILSQNDSEDFSQFIQDNIEKFSSAREKARYYFCKYLFFYIREKCEAYYKACIVSGRQEKFALEELSFLKPLTKLKKESEKTRTGMSPQEKRKYLEETALTPGGIFDEFNYFYSAYVSTDWMEILFELYGEFEQWPQHDKLRIACSLGLCDKRSDEKQKKSALYKLTQMAQEQREREESLDDIYSRNSKEKNKLYQRGRMGEDYFRDFILGRKDVNRGTLIAFLLFVNTKASLDEDNSITHNRLNHILINCGFPQLRPDRKFDRFVMNFLKASDPMDILEAEVEEQVIQGRNFYLYQIYQEAYCHQKELLKYLV